MSNSLSPNVLANINNFSPIPIRSNSSLSTPNSNDNNGINISTNPTNDDIFDFFDDEKNLSSVSPLKSLNDLKNNSVQDKTDDDFFSGIDTSTSIKSEVEFDAVNYSFKNSSKIEHTTAAESSGNLKDNISNSSSPVQPIQQFQDVQQQNQQPLQSPFLLSQYQQPTQNPQEYNNLNLTVVSASTNNSSITEPTNSLQMRATHQYSTNPNYNLLQAVSSITKTSPDVQQQYSDLPIKSSIMYSPLPSPSYFQQFFRPQMGDLSNMPPYLFMTKEQQLAVERYRMMNPHTQYKHPMPFPYQLPGAHPNHPFGARFLHPNMVSNLSNVFMTPNGPVLLGPNNQLIPIIGSHRPIPNSLVPQLNTLNNNLPDASNDDQKKELKKKALKLTKKQTTLQQQQTEAEITRRQHEFMSSMSAGPQCSSLSLINNNVHSNFSRFSLQNFDQHSSLLANESNLFNHKSLFLF